MTDTALPASRLQFAGRQVPSDQISMYLFNVELLTWELRGDGTRALVVPSLDFTPVAANPGGTTTLWANSGAADALYYGASPVGGGGGGSPGGANTQVQFNDSGSFGGDAGLTYVKATDTLTVAGPVLVGNGAVGAPGLSFGSDTDLGLYRISADRLGVATNGVLAFDVSTTAVTSSLIGVFPATAAGAASIRLPHGTKPSAPVNGDLWTTSAGGVFAQINSATVPLGVAAVALTDAATVATDASLGAVFTLTLTGNHTLGNPTNKVPGQTYLWVITQDGSGGHTLSYGSDFTWPAGTPPVVTATAAGVSVITGVYDGVKIRAAAQLAFA
jgi:hypothetical protein